MTTLNLGHCAVLKRECKNVLRGKTPGCESYLNVPLKKKKKQVLIEFSSS